MINTIFYFVDNMSPEQYAEAIQESTISPRTLVFAKDQKKIYMGGQSYGKMDPEDLLQMIHDAVEDGQLEVIRGERGEKGEKGDKGDRGEKGDTVINPYDDTEIRRRIQEITEEMENMPDEIGMTEEQLQRFEELEETVSNITEMTESDVNNLIDTAIDTSQSLLTKIQQHGMDNAVSWSGWNDKMDTWASTYAVAKETDDSTGQQVDIKLSDLKLRQDNISQRVSALQVFVDEHETPVTIEALDALIDQTVDSNESITNIKNTYAYQHNNDVQWVVSGFESQASSGGSFAQMYATDKNATDTEVAAVKTIANGKASIADMVAAVNNTESQAHAAVKATADASFTTNIASYGTRITDVEQTANADHAAISALVDGSSNTITARTLKNTLAGDTGVWNEMKAAFATTVDGDDIISTAKQSIAQSFDKSTWEQYVSYITGIADTANNASTAIADTKAYVDGKKALINQFASFIGNDGVSASSIANKLANSTEAVNSLATKFVTPNALTTATADLVLKSTYNSAIAGIQSALTDLDGNVVKKASIITSINESEESNVTINADKINLNGTVIAQRLTAAGATIGGFVIGSNSLVGTSGTNQLSLSPSSGISLTTNSGNNTAFTLNSDGSGYLANGSLRWSNDGGLDIKADGLILDVEHNWDWVPSQSYKGLAAFGIAGDYSNLITSVSYNYDTNQWVYEHAAQSADASELTRDMANLMSSAIIDASGLGICLFNTMNVNSTYLENEKNDAGWTSGTHLIENGINHIYPNVLIKATTFDGPGRDVATSGLYISSAILANGGLAANGDSTIRGDVKANSFTKIGGTSSQFLKADGSVDSNTYITSAALSGYIHPTISGLAEGDIIVYDGSNWVNTSWPLTGYATQSWVNTQLAGYLPLTGGTLDGNLTIREGYPGLELYRTDTGMAAGIYYGNSGMEFDEEHYSMFHFSGDCYAETFSQTSDETLKNKVADVALTVEQIAEAPSIKFTWKDENKRQDVNVGTIAQYWQEVLPEVVGKDRNNKLTLNYSALATVSVISLAKEVVELRSEVSDLKQRLETLERIVNNA